MVGAEAVGDRVGVVELVALLAAGGLEADAERRQIRLARSASSATTRLESMPPDSSTPTGTSATIRRFTATRRPSSTASCQSPVDQSTCARIAVNYGSQYTWSVSGRRLDDPHRGRRQLAYPAAGSCVAPARPNGTSCSDAGVGSIVVSTPPPASSAGSVDAKRSRPASADVERLDAEAVAREDQPPGLVLDDGEGEHAVEMVDAADAPVGGRP